MNFIRVPVEIDTYYGEPGPVSDPLDQRLVAGMAAAFGEYVRGLSPLRHGASDNLRRRAGRPVSGGENFTFHGPTTGFGKEIGKDTGLRADNPNDRAKIDAYMREAGIPQSSANIAWCAAWLNAQLAHEGVQGSGALSVASFEHWGRAESASQARPGDVMIVYGGAHVGRFTGDIDPKTGRYGFYSGNAGEPGELAPRPGRSQWGGVKEQWISPSGVEFRGITPAQRYHDAAVRAADQANPPSGAGNQ